MASPGPTRALVAVDLDAPAALEDQVDLLAPRVVVALRRLLGGERRLGERLFARVQVLADRSSRPSS